MKYLDSIRGAGGGGGGKGGGGSSITPSESPDTLRSKQYARVLDLVSEGEIEGLVSGLRSVFLDDTPVQNSDGTLNFTGLVISDRTGTQSQDYIPGFPAAESEVPVVTQVKVGAPVVRSISNSQTDAARITISVPQLSNYDTGSAVLGGTSVTFKIEVQANGGGFKAAKIRIIDSPLQMVDSTHGKTDVTAIGGSVVATWSGVLPSSQTYFGIYGAYAYEVQTASYRIDYRAVGAPSWIALKSGTFSGVPTKQVSGPAAGGFGGTFGGITSSTTIVPPSDTASASISGLAEGQYEFRVVMLSGTGTIALSGSGLVYTGTDVISGKSMSKYQRSYRIPLEGSAPWDIRITRLTADSTSANLRNDTWWDSYTEIVDAKLRYPNSAVVGISVDAEQFRAIPKRGYEIKGLKISIPSNYDPVMRTYTGVWDGTFSVAWTDNPAWCFYDMLINDRYGLGAYLDTAQIDKWGLYQIAQYCDELVPNGLGGMEPRFTCNLYLQTQEEAFNVIVGMASIFRAMAYWAGGSIMVSQDAPSNPVALFTPANVIGGAFNYSGSSVKARHTVALVSWNDPADRYRQKIEYVDDADGIALYGVQQTSIVALGCASRGQAHRVGRWLLYSERMETETVTFRAGMDGLGLAPGEIIQTTDPVRAGVRMGGRVLSATTSAITLDASVDISAGMTYTLWAMLPDDTVESRTVTNAPGSTNVLDVSPAFSAAPQSMAIWTLAATNFEPETWRVISITEADSTTAEIAALAYNSQKYLAVEQNLNLEPKLTSVTSAQPNTPSDIAVTEALVLLSPAVVGARVSVSWHGNAPFYEVKYRVGNGNYISATVLTSAIDIQPAEAGLYEIQITAISAVGMRSSTASVSQQVYGLRAAPVDVTNFSLMAISGAAHLSFDASPDLDVQVGGYLRVRHSSATVAADWSSSVDIGPALAGTATNAVLPLVSGTYLAKWVDSSGNESATAAEIVTTAPDVLSMNAVATVTENPSWSGSKTNVVHDTTLGGIKLDSLTSIDSMTDPIDSWGFIDAIGGIVDTGEYVAAGSVDLGAVFTSRLTASMLTYAFDANDLIDSRLDPIDSWPDIDGGLVTDAMATLMVRTTNDDPAGAPSWSAWAPFVVGDWTARAFQFKAVLQTAVANHNVVLKSMSVTVDMPDRIEAQNGIVSGAGTKTVTYSMPFKGVKGIGITAKNMATGDYYAITNETLSGFDIAFMNSAGSAVSRTFDAIIGGYGNG